MPIKWYDAKSRDGAIIVFGDNGESVVADAKGNTPLLVNPQWEPTRVLGLNSDISILFLEQKAQAGSLPPTTGWLLTNGHRFGVVAEQINDSPDFTDLRKAFTKAVFDEALRRLTTQSEVVSHEQLMRPGEREVLTRLLMCLDTKSALTFGSLEVFIDERAVTSEMLYSAAQTFESFAQGLITPDAVPADLLKGMAVTHMRHIPLGEYSRESAHLCWTSTSTCPFLLLLNFRKNRERRQGFIFAPDRRAVFGDDFSGKAVAFLDRALASALLAIISSNAQTLQSHQTPDRGGLLLVGLKNFGHGIWEELQAVDRALQFKSRWTNLPVFYVHKEGGAALYRPLEHLYPELEGRFVYMDTLQGIVDHALTHGVQLFRAKRRFAMRATRDRLTNMARHHGESHALGAEAKTMLQQRPVVVFGLRMSNRHPVDALGFYVRLTEALLKKFGRLSVIFDGMNVDPDTGGPAAAVLNGSAASDGQRELDLELDFVDRFRAAVSDLPIQVQSCVGLPIRDNLFWLSQADFFVAPNGGGLAKVRWALDIPGYVLTSNVNFQYCALVNVYGDNRQTEEPFTPIYMNRPDEVEDVPIQPPRLQRLKRSQIPQPENFIVAEGSVIPRICDLVQMSLEQRDQPGTYSSLPVGQKAEQQ